MKKITCIFALGSFNRDEYWFSVLADTLKEYGKLKVVEKESQIQETIQQQCMSNLVIVDSGSVENLAQVILSLKKSFPAAKIMVMSATPTWKESRDARYAGAMEYCPKSLDRNEILERVEGLIGSP